MRRLERVLACFLRGGMIGAIFGAIGGLMDSGSMMILMPSGPPFWAIVGGFFGCIAGALYGALSKSPEPTEHFINTDDTSDKRETHKA